MRHKLFLIMLRNIKIGKFMSCLEVKNLSNAKKYSTCVVSFKSDFAYVLSKLKLWLQNYALLEMVISSNVNAQLQYNSAQKAQLKQLFFNFKILCNVIYCFLPIIYCAIKFLSSKYVCCAILLYILYLWKIKANTV